MRKFTLLVAALAMLTSFSANAQNEFICPSSGNIADGETLVTNDFFTVKAIYAGAYKKQAQDFCDMQFEGYFEFRTNNPDPSADNNYIPGQEKIGLAVEVKKAVDLSIYYRRQLGNGDEFNPADNKDMLCISTTGANITNTLTIGKTTDDGKYAYAKGTFTLTPGNYVFYRRGSTMQVFGMTWVENTTAGIADVTVAAEENAPVYNLQGVQVDENYKGIVIKNGKKHINK